MNQRAFVALTHTLCTRDWARRHGAGEVPDATPYGLHHLADAGYDIKFSAAPTTSPGILRQLQDAVLHRTGGLEFLHVTAQRRQMSAAETDAVFCYDERTGIPAAAAPAARRAPVTSGIAWLGRPDETPTVHRWAARYALPRMDAMFTQCAPMADLITRHWGIPTARMHFVELGVDTDFFAEQEWPEDSAPLSVASAGEDRFRDHALLIDAVAACRDRGRDVRLELATGLPVSLPTSWGTLYRERMNGRMRDLYRRSTVVAVALRPTATGSGLTVVLEAMASGRPVVVTGNPGIADYVEHGVTGLLVPPDDPDAFAAAIDDLLADPARAREMGAAAARVARSRFTSAAMSARLAKVIATTR